MFADVLRYVVAAYNLCTGGTGERQTDERQQGLDGGGRAGRSRGRYLVMGRKSTADDDRLIVSYVRSLDRQRSRQLRRAMRAMRRQATTICMRDGISAAFASSSAAVSPPYRANGNRNKNKKEGEGKLSLARSSNEMKRSGRRARKQKRRISERPETDTERR